MNTNKTVKPGAAKKAPVKKKPTPEELAAIEVAKQMEALRIEEERIANLPVEPFNEIAQMVDENCPDLIKETFGKTPDFSSFGEAPQGFTDEPNSRVKKWMKIAWDGSKRKVDVRHFMGDKINGLVEPERSHDYIGDGAEKKMDEGFHGTKRARQQFTP